jgi:hypothetical protein
MYFGGVAQRLSFFALGLPVGGQPAGGYRPSQVIVSRASTGLGPSQAVVLGLKVVFADDDDGLYNRV